MLYMAVITMLLALAVVPLPESAHAQMDKSGKYTGKLMASDNPLKVREVDKEHVFVLSEFSGVFWNDAGKGFLHGTSVVCPVFGVIRSGNFTGNGACVVTDNDGDKAFRIAPQWVAQELLRIEGFTDIRYVDFTKEDARRAEAANIQPGAEMSARGAADFTVINPVELAPTLDAGVPITVLGGVHVGCIELFANKNVRGIADLKHRAVGLRWGVVDKWFVSIMASYIGLDPAKDIRWVTITDPSVPIAQVLAEGKIDAFLATPPEPQELRAQNIGHVIVNWAVDRPWSQYFCCMFAGNSEFVRKYPVATKRALRAILKAADLCVSDPTRVARLLVERGVAERYEYALQAMKEIPYNRWREYDAEDSIRFYALRMHEAGFIKANPQRLIAKHTDWRFLNQLKKELKA